MLEVSHWSGGYAPGAVRIRSSLIELRPISVVPSSPDPHGHRRRRDRRKRWAAFAARTRVATSLALGLGACWLAEPTTSSLTWGLPVALVGLAVRAWAAGHLRKNRQVAVSGPYAYVRNPLYIGSFVAAIGLGISANQPLLLVAIGAVFLLWFLPVVGEEESHLRKILPGYRDYEAKVPRFLPTLTARYDSHDAFDPKLYLSNREHSALCGFVAFLAVLWLKLTLL